MPQVPPIQGEGQHLGVALTPTSLLNGHTDSMCFHVWSMGGANRITPGAQDRQPEIRDLEMIPGHL